MSGGKDMILLVEDDKDLGLVLTAGLKSFGFASHHCERMKQAQAWLADHSGVSLIITDIMMPDGNGYDFYKWIRSQDALRDTPVIVCTGLKDQESLDDFLEMGAVDVLRKPFDVRQLVEKMKRMWARAGTKAAEQ